MDNLQNGDVVMPDSDTQRIDCMLLDDGVKASDPFYFEMN